MSWSVTPAKIINLDNDNINLSTRFLSETDLNQSKLVVYQNGKNIFLFNTKKISSSI